MRCKNNFHQGQTAASSSSSGNRAVLVPTQALCQKLAGWRRRIQTAQAAQHAPATETRSPVRSSTLPCGDSSSSSSSPLRSKRTLRHGPASVSRHAAPRLLSTAAAAGAAAANVLSVGDVVEVSCERLGTGGVGVCPWGPSQLVLLVKGALPGEQLTAVITAVKKNYAEGQKVSTQHTHRDAATPACQHYATCGGCSLQALSYPAQLAHKVDYVGQILTRVGNLAQADVAAAQQLPVAADAVYGYRNKVQMAFSSLVWQEKASEQQQQQQQQQGSPGVQGSVQQGSGLGYFLPGSSSVVVPIQECSLASPEMNQGIGQVRQLCQQHGLQPHNAPDGTGVLRHLIVRSAAAAAATAQDTAPTALARPSPAAAAAAAPLGSSADIARAAEAGPSVPTVPAAAGGSTHAPAPGGDTRAERKLMVVLVTSPAISSQPQALEALASVAEQLMHSCPSLASVVHSIEARPAAAAGDGSAGRSTRSASIRSKQGSSRHKGGSSNSSSRGSQSDSDGEGSSANSSRGAQPLRVQSSQVLAGADSLVEHMCGLQFQVSPHSFFQTNTDQAERLYELAVQAVAEVVGAASSSSMEPSPAAAGGAHGNHSPQQQPYPGSSTEEAVVLDLYCGTGTIALCLASALPGQQVVGFDVSASSISDARANAARNGLDNVSFVCGDLNQLLPAGADNQQAGKKNMYSKQVGRQGKRLKQAPAAAAALATGQQEPAVQLQKLQPRVVVVDPARAGLSAGVVQYLLRCGAERVVYVSCNAATQARDLQVLCGGGVFKLTAWTCVDLFPQTDVAHVETVVVLDRAA